MIVIIRERQTQGRETTFAKIDLSTILFFALYLSSELTEGAGEVSRWAKKCLTLVRGERS